MNRNNPLVIPHQGLKGREGVDYFADPRLVDAINAAILLERPLLLTGEPGCGKTDFAHAVANHVHRAPNKLREAHVRSDSRARDLLYHYDALHRFGEANMPDDALRKRSAEPRHYVKLLPLGEALVSANQEVVLIDEIDKAPRDLPNDLLRELDRGEFEISELPADPENTSKGHPLQRTMKRPQGAPAPIIVITSNVERQLPDPFLRRCVFYHVRFPDEAQLSAILKSRAPGFPYLEQVINLFLALRDVPKLTKKPATSELIDWARDLHDHEAHRGKPVGAALRDLHDAVSLESKGDKLVRKLEPRAWAKLPAIHCLLKLREDLEAVGC